MKMIKPTAFAILAICFASATATAQEPVSLKWKFKTGSKIAVEMNQSMDMTMNLNGQNNTSKTVNKSWMTWEVKGVKDGVAEMDTRIERMKIDVETAGIKMGVDTDVPAGTDGQDPTMGKMVRGIVGVKLMQSMNSNGKIVSMVVPDEIKKMMGPAGGEMVESLSRNGSLEFPAEPLTVGKSWKVGFTSPSPAGKMKLNNTYTYRGTQQRSGSKLHAFEVDIKMEFVKGAGPVSISITNQNTKGVMYFDAEKGRLAESIVNQDVEMLVEAQGQKMQQSLKSKAEIKFTDSGS